MLIIRYKKINGRNQSKIIFFTLFCFIYNNMGGMMNLIIMCIFAYFLGSVPNAVWVGKVFKNVDVREHGSKNAGSTNAARVLGAKLGILVLVLDVLKGVIPTYLALGINTLGNMTDIAGIDPIIIGIIAILGHTFSIFLKFNGGKGVATTLGVFLVLAPKAVFFLFIIFFLLFAVFRYVSLSSVVSAACLPFFVYFIYKNIPLTIVSLILVLVIIVKHKSNIQRLINGTENKFKVTKDGEK